MKTTVKLGRHIHPIILISFIFIVVGFLSLLFDRSLAFSATTADDNNFEVNSSTDQVHLRKTFDGLASPHLKEVTTLYVVPGGGGGAQGMPLWTKQRLDQALHLYKSEKSSNGGSGGDAEGSSVFVLLSAGSFNAASGRQTDGRLKFECQYMIDYLLAHDVPLEHIYGDFMSWDTVTNGLVLRMYVEAILAIRPQHSLRHPPLQIRVFISDFHADRVKSSFQWVLGLEPSLIDSRVAVPSAASTGGRVSVGVSVGGVRDGEDAGEEDQPRAILSIHSVSSQGVQWPSKEAFASRIQHEARGVALVEAQAKDVRTMPELLAFLLLGPHAGIRSYLLGSYRSSGGTSAGW